jgi:hypothetical protein
LVEIKKILLNPKSKIPNPKELQINKLQNDLDFEFSNRIILDLEFWILDLKLSTSNFPS